MKNSILFLGKAQIFRLRRAKINIIGVKGSFLTAAIFSLCIAKSEKITLPNPLAMFFPQGIGLRKVQNLETKP